jgi:hypothetical protein
MLGCAVPERDRFQRWAAVAAIVSAPLALVSIFVALPAVNYDFTVLSDPIALLQRGGLKMAPVMRCSLVLDLLGYYLLIAPLALFLGLWLRVRHGAWARLFSGCLLVYVVLGAAGASVLAAVTPRLFALHAAASPEQRPAIEAIYAAFTDAVYAGLWNMLEELIAGVGWLGLGWLLRRERPFIGVVMIVLGVACIVDSAGTIFRSESVATVALGVYLLLAPLWALGLGISLLRRPASLSA